MACFIAFGAGCADPSPEETLETSGAFAAAVRIVPTAPVNLVATSNGSTSARLSWAASSGGSAVTKYRIFRNGGSVPIGAPKATTFVDSGLAPRTTYSYTVKAVDAAGNVSPASNTATFTTPPELPWNCAGIQVSPSDDLAAVTNSAAPGTTICIGKGVYRLTSTLIPRSSVTLWGEPGAKLNGSSVVSSWTAGNGYWYASGRLPPAYSGTGDCEDNVNYPCRLGEQVFRDETHLERVMGLGQLKTGTFFADYAANRVYVADDPAGHLMELARLRTAISSAASDVTLRGLIVEKCATQAQDGAIRVNGARWKVVENEVRSNHGTGIRVYGGEAVVSGNHIHHNGQLGIGGNAVSKLVIEDNLVVDNNTDGFWINDWESGGIKFTRSSLVVRGNQVLDNRSVGVWLDIDCKGVVVENNLVSGNWADGVRYEISYDGRIIGNKVVANALRIGRNGGTSIYYGAGITVHSSRNVEVANNVVDGNLNGIALQARNRGTGVYGSWVLTDATVHDNDIGMVRGQTGMVQNLGAEYFTTKGNRFFNNIYRLDSLDAKRFQWKDSARTKDEWYDYGQDRFGTFLLK